jgi:hypothetical protein
MIPRSRSYRYGMPHGSQLCDPVFPHRAGWFSEFCEESRTWIAAAPAEARQLAQRIAGLAAWPTAAKLVPVQAVRYQEYPVLVLVDRVVELLIRRLDRFLSGKRAIRSWLVVEEDAGVAYE